MDLNSKKYFVINKKLHAINNYCYTNNRKFFKSYTHLKTLSSFEKSRQLAVLDVDLALVHEVDKRPQLLQTHVLEDHDRVPRRMVHEQRAEVR